MTTPSNIGLGTGSQLGPYQIQGYVGAGGMGVVFKAYHKKMDRVVALKVLKPELAAQPGYGERFLREARAAAKITHAHVVAIYDVDEQQGMVYSVFEFVEGGDLAQLLKARGPLQLPWALRLVCDCAEGLEAMHRARLVHRDIKPHNIFLNAEGRAKLGDFGLARIIQGEDLTLPGMVMGTPAYMAPEQAEGEQVDHRADINALGATLYALLTGKPPFSGATAVSILVKVKNDPPPDVRAEVSNLPREVAEAIQRAMAKRREDRFQSAAEMRLALERIGAALQRPPPPSPTYPPAPMPLPPAHLPPPGSYAPPFTVTGGPTYHPQVPTGMVPGAPPPVPPPFPFATNASTFHPPAAAKTPWPLIAAVVLAVALVAVGVVLTVQHARSAAAVDDLHTRLQALDLPRPPYDQAAADLQAYIVQSGGGNADSARWQDKLARIAKDQPLAAALDGDGALEIAARDAAAPAEDDLIALIGPEAAKAPARLKRIAEHRALETRLRATLAPLEQPFTGDDAELPAMRKALAAWKSSIGAQEPLPTWQRNLDAAAQRDPNATAQRPSAQGDPAARNPQAQPEIPPAFADTLPNPAVTWPADSGHDAAGAWADLKIGAVVQRMRLIPAGKMSMGSPPDEDGRERDEAQHDVTLTHPYWIADSECTQALWQAVAGANPAHFNDDPQRPVEQVSWLDVERWLKTLNQRAPALDARLPTEAQWEYACRAGTTTPWASANGPDGIGWNGANAGGGTHPVKKKDANAWGLYDMEGNVWEWCADFYGDYPDSAQVDPTGPASTQGHVLRGGSWGSSPQVTRCAFRLGGAPDFTREELGFRFCVDAAP